MSPSPRQGSPNMTVTPASRCKALGGCRLPMPPAQPLLAVRSLGKLQGLAWQPLPRGLQGPCASCGSVPSGGWGPWLQSRLWVAQCRGKPCQWRRLWATLCSAAASILYAAAIVTYSQQPACVLRALPWLLIALGLAALDVVVSFSSSSPRALSWHMLEDGARLLS